MVENMFVVNVEAVVFKEDHCLLTRRSPDEPVAPGRISFPGGKVELSDAGRDILEQTVRRELAEETGITVSEVVYAGSKLFVTDDGTPVVNVIFCCDYKSGEARVNDSELSSVFWCRTEDVARLPELPPWTLDSYHMAAAVRE